MKFKKGDVVVCVDHSGSLEIEKGKNYKVDNAYKGCETEMVDILIDGKIRKYFFASRFIHNIPNNKLSRVIYPKHVESKCGKYLIKEIIE